MIIFIVDDNKANIFAKNSIFFYCKILGLLKISSVESFIPKTVFFIRSFFMENKLMKHL